MGARAVERASRISGGTGHAIGAFGGGTVAGYQWARNREWTRGMGELVRSKPGASPEAAEAEAAQKKDVEAAPAQTTASKPVVTEAAGPAVSLYAPERRASGLKSGLDSTNGRSQAFTASASGGGQQTPVRTGTGWPSVPDRAGDLARLGIKPHPEAPAEGAQAMHKHVLPLMQGTFGSANAAAAWTKPGGDSPMPISTATIGSTFTPNLTEPTRRSGLGWPG